VWSICLVAAMGGLLFGYDWVVVIHFLGMLCCSSDFAFLSQLKVFALYPT
jgi:hypothetical protein